MKHKIKHRVCRVCLDTKFSNGIHLDNESSWLNLYEFCVGLTIDNNDLTRTMCMACAKLLKSYAKFKRKCQKSNKIWKERLESEYKIRIKNDENVLSSELTIKEDFFNGTEIVDVKVEPDQFCDELETFSDGESDCEIPLAQIKRQPKIKTSLTRDFFSNSKTEDVIKIEFSDKGSNDCDLTFAQIKSKQKVGEFLSSTKINVKAELEQFRDTELKTYTDKKGDDCVTPLIPLAQVKRKAKVKRSLIGKVKVKKSYKKLNEQNKKIEKSNKIPKHRNVISLSIPTLPMFFNCGLCEVTSPDCDFIKKHLEEHRSKDELNCKLCDYVGKDFADMVTHRYSHHSTGTKVKYKCHICDKRLAQMMPLQFHFRTVHLGKLGGLCSVCNRVFKRYKNWRDHEKLHLDTTHKYICDHCDKPFLYKTNLVAHLKDISDVKSHVCDVCGKAFKRLRSMMSHISKVHDTKSVPVKCNHCNRTYKNKQYYDKHMKKVLAKKDFTCEICAKGFISSNVLETHMIWHRDDRPHACHLCDAKYKVKSQLTKHILRHRGILPYKCDYCSKCFLTPGQRLIHTAVHTGIRPYKCIYCVRSFNEKKMLVTHCVLQHKTAVIKENCNFIENKEEN